MKLFFLSDFFSGFLHNTVKKKNGSDYETTDYEAIS